MSKISTAMEYSETEKKILAVLDKVRPFLQRDGGNIEYIGFKDGTVYVKMMGACEGCVMADSDISAGVEIILVEEVPGVVKCTTQDIPEDVQALYDERSKSK